jgi:hypothetical protein
LDVLKLAQRVISFDDIAQTEQFCNCFPVRLGDQGLIKMWNLILDVLAKFNGQYPEVTGRLNSLSQPRQVSQYASSRGARATVCFISRSKMQTFRGLVSFIDSVKSDVCWIVRIFVWLMRFLMTVAMFIVNDVFLVVL